VAIRILFVADSHLGFDLPMRARVERRRRGHDFFANYRAALEPAFAGEVDLVVHGGDVFDRPTVHPTIAYQALEPLTQIADLGVPVFIVPGNHERSRIPHARFASHPRVHVFDRPRTFVAEILGDRIALSGFPYERRGVRSRFTELLAETRWNESTAAHRLVCMHHCVEGATVGPGNFTFTTAADVIRARDVPSAFAAVLSGHIHRHQVLTRDLNGHSLAAPVLYPGSVERTSVAEIGEPKGFLIVRLGNDSEVDWDFRRLPARPMVREELEAEQSATALESKIADIVARAPRDAVVSIRVSGMLTRAQWSVVSPVRLRAIAPETMNIEVTAAAAFNSARLVPHARAESDPQLSLYDSLACL
jgi:DNA repair exonuclease SbcCD nuclease subunit